MTEGIISTLFLDPQQELRIRYCSRCGGVRYWPCFICIRCLEDGYDT